MVVVDGYEFSREFFAVLEESNTPFAVIDDNAETQAHSPSAVINQNPHASAEMYSQMQGNPELLLGLQYAMVREEVRDIAALHLQTREGEVFVAMGGADFLGLTSQIVEALAETGLHVRVAVGHANNRRAEVEQLADRYSNVTLIEQHEYVSSLASAHVAVLAAGSSLWEACAVGTPSIGLIVADNQFQLAMEARRLGLVHVIDVREMSHYELKEEILKVVSKLPLRIKNIQPEVPTQILEGTSNLSRRLRELIKINPEIV
jgi:spore coat polysaccharide biosynthesis predicted glycosyltransferase SpsG